ncbi:hypothetical protein ZWY2020_033160 [Hordeum vulgare]|nr:hypothetical protein ZWY2020_033160 [Hordeum vulgare]
MSSLFIRDNISVGASAALFGPLGAMLSMLFTNWTIYTKKCYVMTSSVKDVGRKFLSYEWALLAAVSVLAVIG